MKTYQLPVSIEYIDKYCSDALETIPGTKAIIAIRVHYIAQNYWKYYGKSFEETLEENILKSLKMQNTSMLKSATIVPGLVSSYTKSEQINLKMMRRI
jgi:hypothetical protein